MVTGALKGVSWMKWQFSDCGRERGSRQGGGQEWRQRSVRMLWPEVRKREGV